MKMRMIAVLAMVIGSASYTGIAQAAGDPKPDTGYASADKYRTANLKKVSPGYLFCLRSDNDGVVENAIGIIARMKLYKPTEELRDLRNELGRLAVNGRTPSIKYRAYLAGMLMANPQWFTVESARDYPLDQDLYLALSTRLTAQMLNPSTKVLARAEVH